MFYVIERKYVGPNPEDHADSNTIEVRTTPSINMNTNEPCIAGFSHSINDWAEYAHGEFETLALATAAVKELFGTFREQDLQTEEYGHDDTLAIVVKLGKYQPLSLNDTINAYADMMEESVCSHSDEEIKAFINEYEEDANAQGCTLSPSFIDYVTEHRDNYINASKRLSADRP